MGRPRLPMLALAGALIVMLALPSSAFAVTGKDADRHRAQADRARAAAAAAQKAADQLGTETRYLEGLIDASSARVAALSGQLMSAQQRLDAINGEVAKLQAQVDVAQAEIDDAGARMEEQRAAMGDRAVELYQDDRFSYLEILLTARDLGDLLQRAGFVQQVIEHDQDVVAELTKSQRTYENAKLKLGTALAQMRAKRAEVKGKRDEVDALRSTHAAALAEQRSAEAKKSALLAETQQNIARLKKVIAAEEAESARIEALLSANSGGHSTGGGSYSGSMAWPVPSSRRVTSGFGWRVHPVLHTKKFHKGIDIGAPSGATIVAAGKGTVIYAGYRGGYGNTVMIDHGDGLVTVYAHQSRIATHEGAKVSRGQTIGYVGSTGMSTGPHLHFETRVNGNAKNPMSYL